MTKKLEIYKCEICGNIVEVVHSGAGTLVCCGKNMKLFEEKTEDSAKEKHVPFVEKISEGSKVKIGQNAAHPMEEKHYIEWVEIINNDYVNRKFLKPGEQPEADFFVHYKEGMVVREYCNVHGLWKS